MDVGHARTVAAFDWVSDEIWEIEVLALEERRRFVGGLGCGRRTLAERYVAFASKFDTGSGFWTEGLFELSDLIVSDVASAEIVLDTRYFDDGEFFEDEVSGLLEVIRYTLWNPDFGLMVSGLDWVSDGVDFWEQDALFHVSRFFEIDPELGSKAVEIGWIVTASDEDPGGQLKSLTQLLEIAMVDAEFAGQMMDWDWLRDDLSYAEPNLLGFVYEIMSVDPRIAKLLPLVVADGFETVDEDTYGIADTVLTMTI